VTLDDFNTIAWRDFLTWAWSEPEMREQFTIATGVEIRSVRAPIDAAIDAATGASESVAARFIAGATREHWGVEHAPKAYQKAIASVASRHP
jgi:hypothetical protein